MSVLDDILSAIITAVSNDTGVPVAVVTTVVNAVEAAIAKLEGGDTEERQSAIKGLETYADAGNAAALIQLANWAGKVGSQYPHGAEPAKSIPDAQAALQRVEAAHPTFLSQVTIPGGKNGDSPLDSPSPLLH